MGKRMANSGEKRVYLAIAGLMGILYGIMFYIYPLCGDDQWYLEGVSGGTWTWEALSTGWEHVWDLWHASTGRLGNLSSALFLMFFPRWIWATLMGLCCFLILQIGPRLIGSRWTDLRSGCWILGFCLIYPWLDYIFSIIYSLNYLPSTFFGLCAWYLFVNHYSDEDRKVGLAITLSGFMVAFLAGWWHEGLAVPLGCGMAAYAFTVRKRPSKVSVFIFAGVVLGMVMIAFSPSFWNSMDFREPIWRRGSLAVKLLHLIGFNCCTYAYIFLMAVILLRKKSRRRLIGERQHFAKLVGILVIGLVTLPIYVKYYAGPRTGIFSQMFCLYGILAGAPYLFCSGKRHGKSKILLKLNASVFAIICLLCFINLVAAIRMQVKLTGEYEEVERLWNQGGKERGCVFYDVTPISIGLDMMKPSYMALNTSYGLCGKVILPSALSEFTGTTEAGICSDDRLMIHNGLLIYRGRWDMGPQRKNRPDLILITYDGKETRSAADWYAFKDTQGEEYTYVEPHVQKLNRNIHIRDAKILK